MVMAELGEDTGGGAPWSVDRQSAHRLSVSAEHLLRLWKRITGAAGIPEGLWNRDLRAGAATEGGQAGAKIDDMAKQFGHTNKRTTAEVYDRERLEAHRRVARARVAYRDKNGGGT